MIHNSIILSHGYVVLWKAINRKAVQHSGAQTLPVRPLCCATNCWTPAWIAPVQNSCVAVNTMVMVSRVLCILIRTTILQMSFNFNFNFSFFFRLLKKMSYQGWICPAKFNLFTCQSAPYNSISETENSMRKKKKKNERPRKEQSNIYPMASRVSAQVVREEAAAVCKLRASHWAILLSPVAEVAMPTTPAMSEKTTKKPVAMFPIGRYIGNMRAGICRTEAANAHHICYRKL